MEAAGWWLGLDVVDVGVEDIVVVLEAADAFVEDVDVGLWGLLLYGRDDFEVDEGGEHLGGDEVGHEGQAGRGLLDQEHLGVEVAGVLAGCPPGIDVGCLEVGHDDVFFVGGEQTDEVLQEELAYALGELKAYQFL